jgi:hypothetical protein
MDIAPDVAEADEGWQAALDRAIGPMPADLDAPVGVEVLVAAGRRRLRRRRAILASTSLVSAAVVAALVGGLLETGTRTADVVAAREDLSAAASISGSVGSAEPSSRQPSEMGSIPLTDALGDRLSLPGAKLATLGLQADLGAAAAAAPGSTISVGPVEAPGPDTTSVALGKVYDVTTRMVGLPEGYEETGRITDPIGPGSVAWSMASVEDPSRYEYMMVAFVRRADGIDPQATAAFYDSGAAVLDALRSRVGLRTWVKRKAPELVRLRAAAARDLVRSGRLGQSQ